MSVKGSESCQTKAEKCPWSEKDPCLERDFCRNQGLGDQTGESVFRDDTVSVGKSVMKAER